MTQLSYNEYQNFSTPQAAIRNSVYFTPGMTLKNVEKDVILETLRQNRFNRTRTAKILDIGIRTLQRKLKQYRENEMQKSQAMQVVN